MIHLIDVLTFWIKIILEADRCDVIDKKQQKNFGFLYFTIYPFDLQLGRVATLLKRGCKVYKIPMTVVHTYYDPSNF